MIKYFHSKKSLAIISFTMIFLFLTSLSTKEIRSTKEGGNWCEPKTWVTGEIPGENDKVIIDGEVLVNCPAFANEVFINVDGFMKISEKDSLICNLIILDEKDGKKGQIQNKGIIIVEEKKNKTGGGE